MKKQLWHLLVGTNGGVKRAKVVRALNDYPCTTSQLSDRLDEHYNTIRYHLEILQEENIVTSSGDSYGEMYFLTDEFEQHSEEFEKILDRLDL